RFRGVPAIDAVILTCSEVVVLAPLDRPATQSLRIDFHVFHGRADLRGVGRPTAGLEHGFEYQSADPAFRHLLGRIAYVRFFRFLYDLLVDGQIVLKQGIRADDIEFSILEARQFALGLDVRPGDVIALPAEPAQ